MFIGGNHEASNHLQELPYGGWVAPNIYYLGKVPAGCRRPFALPRPALPRPRRDEPRSRLSQVTRAWCGSAA